MKYGDDKQDLHLEYNEIIFEWDNKPIGDLKEIAEKYSIGYYSQLNNIALYVLSEIKDIFGEHSVEEVVNKLGQPIINLDMKQVTYCNQTFDDIHIFSFCFSDDKFNKLCYFAMDG